MADTWYYESDGTQTGPISFQQLVELIQMDGGLDQAAFRSDDTGRWISARSIAHVLREGLTLEERAPESSGAQDDLSLDELHDLARLCADLMSVHHLSDQDAVAGAPAPTVESQPAQEPEHWYCRVFDTELGPMPFEDLRSLARNGGLSLEDEVRLGSQGAWLAARAVEELLPEISEIETEPMLSTDGVLEGQASSRDESKPLDQQPIRLEDGTPDIVLGDDAPDTSNGSAILNVVEAGTTAVVRFDVTRLGSEDRSRQCREELDRLASEHSPEQVTLDLDGVKTLPGPILKSLVDISREGTRVVLVNSSEQIREDVEFSQLDRWLEVADAGHSVVGE